MDRQEKTPLHMVIVIIPHSLLVPCMKLRTWGCAKAMSPSKLLFFYVIFTHLHVLSVSQSNTTRKPEKSNRIIDRIFLSVIYTNENNSISKSVGIYRRTDSVGNSLGIYRRNISVGIYCRFHRRNIQFVWKYATAWWRQAILQTESTEGFKLW